MNVFVSCPKGMQYLLETELKELGVEKTKPVQAGVEASVDSAGLYRVLLWSRIANRVFLSLGETKVENVESIYQLALTIPWEEHFDADTTFSVSFSGTNSFITNSTFGALKIKDAIVDYFRAKTGTRPSVSKTEPQIRVAAKLAKGRVTISLDLSGESLHKRGYRTDKGPAPLKENVAAALLRQAGWHNLSKEGSIFLDPMCGSGTFCVEAALIATNRAPGLSRIKWGFDNWIKHDAGFWQELVSEASDAALVGVESFKGKIVGYDADKHVIAHAWQNVDRAGMREIVHVEKRELNDFQPVSSAKGLLLTNPPYGERLGEVKELAGLYRRLGEVFDDYLHGWRAGVFTGNADLEKHIGWRYLKRYKHFNGAIESALLLYDLQEGNRFKRPWVSDAERVACSDFWKVSNPERAQMLENRLAKNQKGLAKFIKRNDITCYRAYDADMPEFAFAIDVYNSVEGEQYLYVQEYAPPKSVDHEASLERLCEGLAVVRSHFGIPSNQIFIRQRQVQKGLSQYEREPDSGVTFAVSEYGARLEVQLGEYLDTGLFLDHRPMRQWMQLNSRGKKVLNLFAYTCAVSLQAALGGACSVLSVDMSKTYLAWGQRNFKLNGLSGGNYRFERADCVEWLAQHSQELDSKDCYDVIFLDPPSFSNSKRMEGVFDVQRDHAQLVENAMKLLSTDGVLVFSNNLRKFTLDDALSDRYQVSNHSRQSIDQDFQRNAKIHQCWFIKHKSKD